MSQRDFLEYSECLGFGARSYAPTAPLPAITVRASETENPGMKNFDLSLNPEWASISTVRVLTEANLQQQGPEIELLEKMLGAIGLLRSQVELLQIDAQRLSDLPSNFDLDVYALGSKKILVLGKALGSLLLKSPRSWAERRGSIVKPPEAPEGQLWILSHSPGECLLNSGLKKIVWEDLKTFKGSLES